MPAAVEEGQLGGRKLRRVVYDAAQIEARVADLAADISAAYTAEDRLLVIGILKGSFVFLADLARRIALPLQIDFVAASSYGAGQSSSGEVKLLLDVTAPVEGRAVLLVEDIVDSGTTLRSLIPRVRARGPASLEVCALLHKRTIDLEPRWVGFDAPNEFLVGYGLDIAEDFRHLPYIASL
ncbi:MAG: hypoxanthine phosphoribosyltransferase [Gemmatimonadales bacterium]